MKQLRTLIYSAVLCLATGSALAAGHTSAANHAHYGQPTPTMATTGGTTAKYAVPLVVTNNTYQEYNVQLTQADGSRDNMPIQPVNNYPYNVISINRPAWPVHVELFTLSGKEFFNQYIQPDDPNVTINPSSTLGHVNGSQTLPSVTTSSTR